MSNGVNGNSLKQYFFYLHYNKLMERKIGNKEQAKKFELLISWITNFLSSKKNSKELFSGMKDIFILIDVTHIPIILSEGLVI